MDFRELQYITTVAECKSVTAAAKKLFISQPSLSYIISKIEQEVGVKLFDRRKSPLTLTYAGEKYVETARKILALNENLRKELVDIGLGEKGKIVFGMPPERTGYMLPRVIPEYKKRFPKVEVEIVEGMADELLAALQRDEINFYIMPRSGRELPAGVISEEIYMENLYLVASATALQNAGITNLQNELVGREFIESQPFILIKKGHEIRRKEERILKNLKANPEIAMEVASCIGATQLADAGLGITIVPRRALEALGGVDRFCYCRYAEQIDAWPVHVIYKEDTYLGRAERCFIDLIKDVFAEY